MEDNAQTGSSYVLPVWVGRCVRWRGKSDRVPSHSDTRVESALLVDQLTHSHSSVDSVETHVHTHT